MLEWNHAAAGVRCLRTASTTASSFNVFTRSEPHWELDFYLWWSRFPLSVLTYCSSTVSVLNVWVVVFQGGDGEMDGTCLSGTGAPPRPAVLLSRWRWGDSLTSGHLQLMFTSTTQQDVTSLTARVSSCSDPHRFKDVDYMMCLHQSTTRLIINISECGPIRHPRSLGLVFTTKGLKHHLSIFQLNRGKSLHKIWKVCKKV